MFAALEIAICLTAVYALGSLVCSSIQELLAQLFELRWRNLRNALSKMFQADDMAKVFQHPLIRDLWDANLKPTALPSPVFARAVVHAFEGAGVTPSRDAAELLTGLPLDVQKQLVPFLNGEAKAAGDLYAAAERWFETSMAAASDRYSRTAAAWGLAVAVAFAIGLNIDTLGIASKLSREPSRRIAMVSVAQQLDDRYKQNPDALCSLPDATTKVATCIDKLTDVSGDLLGWNDTSIDAAIKTSDLPMMLLGWVASGFAMSLGAKFWFDALSRLLSIRSGLSDTDLSAAKKSAEKVASSASS